MTNRKAVTLAFAASIWIHLIVALVTWNADLIGASDWGTARAEPEPLELVLMPDPQGGAEPDQPTAYTDIPERLASEEPPERADFLALHDSRAADMTPDGEPDSKPAAEEETPFEQVAIDKEQLEDAGSVAYTPTVPAAEPGSPQPTGPAGDSERQPQDQQLPPTGDYPVITRPERQTERPGQDEAPAEPVMDLPELLGSEAPSILRPGLEVVSGDPGFDFDQIASGSLTGNMLQTGGYSLNTYEWNWAPWMQRFGQDVRRHWFAPYAYALGVIDGMTRLKIVIERNGACSSLEVQETEGHESLEQASLAAIKAAAPFLPLPSDFPEENLVIILTLHYPAWKTEPPAQRSQPNRSRPQRRSR